MKSITHGNGLSGLNVLFSFLFPKSHPFRQTIKVVKLSAAPTLDGNSSDWSGVNAVTIPLFKTEPNKKTLFESVSVKSRVAGEKTKPGLLRAGRVWEGPHTPTFRDSLEKLVGVQAAGALSHNFRLVEERGIFRSGKKDTM